MRYLLALIGLSLVVIIHELGHYCGALLGGMRVKQFALGFGPRLFGLRGRETDFRVNAVPLGGYVMVDGGLEEEGATNDDPRLMQNRPARSRAIYALCGPLFNFAFAFGIVLAAIGAQGLPASRAITVSQFEQGSPAAEAGLRLGDRLIAVDGVRVENVQEAVEAIGQADERVLLRVERDGKILNIESALRHGRLLVYFRERIIYTRGGLTPAKALAQAWSTTRGMFAMVFEAIGALISGRAGLRDLSGPVGMVGGVAAAAGAGWTNFLMVLALISVNLGLLNLVPVPALDGGRLLLLALEKIFKDRFSLKIQALISMAGFALLLALIILVTIKDIVK